MTYDQYKRIAARAAEELRRHRYSAALGSCRIALEQAGSPKHLLDQLERQQQIYGFLCQYALDGYADPTRDAQLANMAGDLKRVLALGERELHSADDSRAYYSKLRYARLHPEITINNLASRAVEAARRHDMAALTGSGDATQLRQLRNERERAEREIFDLVWVSAPLSAGTAECLSQLLTGDSTTRSLKASLCGALLLGNLQISDPARMRLLAEAADRADTETSLRALTYLIIALAMDQERSGGNVGNELAARLAAMADKPGWRDDVAEIFRQLIRSRDTDRVTRKLQDEIFPGLQNLSSKVSDMLKRKQRLDDTTRPEDALEWENLLADTGMEKTMHELSAIESEGGDVMMTSFAGLKRFSFFKDAANWFIPFDPDHTALPEGGRAASVASTVTSAPMLCDNDKYSLMFSISAMPSGAKEIVDSQLQGHADSMAELEFEMLERNRSHEHIITGVVRDLYRFFKLYERAPEFDSPFDTSMNLMAVPALAPLLDRDALLDMAADFYFTHGYYAEAMPLLADIESHMQAGSEGRIYFRLGVCAKQLGMPDKALEYLERSELFDETDRNTVFELGMAYRQSGNHRKAYEYFRRLSTDRPDDTGLQLHMAAELIELERYDQALELLYKLEYLYGLSPAFARKMARCELMLGRHDKCRAHLERLADHTVADMVTHAVIDVATGSYRNAVTHLRGAMTLGGHETALADFNSFRPLMTEAGASSTIIDLIIDNAI